MDKEKDFMDEIFRGTNESSGFIGHQKELYQEFLRSFHKQNYIAGKRIVSFEPLKEVSHNIEMPMKLAAMSNDLKDPILPKHEFFYNAEFNIGLKVDIRSGNQIFINVIAESGTDYSDAIIFCKETLRSFISLNKGEYFIGTVENFDIDKFKFDMLFPYNRIFMFMENDNFSHFSKNIDYGIDALTPNEKGLEVKLSINSNPKTVVLKSKNYKDFITIQKNNLIIPNILLDRKMEILLY